MKRCPYLTFYLIHLCGFLNPNDAFPISLQLKSSLVEQSLQKQNIRHSTLLYEKKKASIQLTTPQLPTTITPTSLIDYALSLVTSDLSSIVLGSIGILLALANRLNSIDLEASSIAAGQAVDMGTQSRMDLLAVFSAGAVLLNGVSKLDVTSVIAETVELEGTLLDDVEYVDIGMEINQNLVNWALHSVLQSSPAVSAVLLVWSKQSQKWNICALRGVVPYDPSLRKAIPVGVSTPILDRFLRNGEGNEETYLPTLQALPGRAEITYLPQNTQGVLMVPINIVDSKYDKAALVLGSDTAKSFTPRDVAWCQLIANRLGTCWNESEKQNLGL